jgi:uncharacterized protein YjbJ (UPF0337 family)
MDQARDLHYVFGTLLYGGFMNKDHVKGAAKDIGGKVQEKAGELTGSEKQQLKGVKNQVEGKIQKGVGDVKDAFKDADETRRP